MPHPEPDPDLHYFFTSYADAIAAYMELSDAEREVIDPPRQTHGGWIFDKEVV
jgi:hypothetical protein